MAAPRDRKGSRRHDNKMPIDEQSERVIPGRLDEETMGYYKRVSETFAEEFETQEEKGLFVQNVLAQTRGEEIKLSQNQTVSRILENLIRNANKKDINKFLKGLSHNFKKVSFDRFAAYVLQTIVAKIPVLSDEAKDEETEDLPSFDSLLMQLCDELKENLSEVLCDVYASHVLRVVFEVLAGVQVSESVVRSRLSRQQRNKEDPKQVKPEVKRKPPKKFTKMLTKLTKLILKREDIKDLVFHSASNPVLQTLLLVLQQVNSDLCTDLCQVIMSHSGLLDVEKSDSEKDERRLPTIFTHEVGSHLVEVLLKVGSDDIIGRLYSESILGHVILMAVHPIANFVLQKFVTSMSSKQRFEELFDECVEGFEEILAMNHLGVILRFAEGCVKFETGQVVFVKSLMKSFHCYKPKSRQPSFVKLVASFATYEVFYNLSLEESKDTDSENKDNVKKDEDKETENVELQEVNMLGSLLVQQMLKFQSCQKIVDSFMSLSQDELLTLACDQSGSHIVEAFLKSGAGEKKRDEFIERLKGRYLKMSCTKHGSRTVDAIWNTATLKNKFTIAEELAKKESQLSQDLFGRFVYRNCAIGHFKHRQKDWKDIQTREEKKRKMFSDLIGEEIKSSKKVKKETEAKEKGESKYGKEMAQLGFDGSTVTESTEKEAMDSDGNDDEIDNLFKKRKVNKKKAKRKSLKEST